MDRNNKVVHVGNTNSSRDHVLLQTFTQILDFRVGHLAANFVDIRGPDEEDLWHDLGFLVHTSCIATVGILQLGFAEKVVVAWPCVLFKGLFNGGWLAIGQRSITCFVWVVLRSWIIGERVDEFGPFPCWYGTDQDRVQSKVFGLISLNVIFQHWSAFRIG